jgi:hypothetical protein
MIVPRLIFFEWEMFQTKVVEKTKTHILCPVTFSEKSCSLWDSGGKYGGRVRQVTDHNIIRYISFACCITKATDTYSEYEIFIAFPRQKWLRERASVLRYKYIASIFYFKFRGLLYSGTSSIAGV